MLYLQILINGVLLGGLYSCIAVGFSLVWGVLNIINILHGSLMILGAYAAFFAHAKLGIHPFLFVPVAGLALFVFGYAIQAGIINRVMGAPVLITLTLTFGLNLVLDNAMIVAFKADYRKVILDPPLGLLEAGPLLIPMDRLYAMVLALVLVGILYGILRATQTGRAIVAVRMDRDAAALMGVDVKRIYAITFATGAFTAGAAGSLMSVIFPISPLTSNAFLGKAFVICVLGGLGSMPGVMVGGILLGVLESFGTLWLGPDFSTTIAFVLLLVLLLFRPTGLMGKKGFE
jgi:branched-chain amino acid transport system permease protein